MKPPKSILSPEFKYRPAALTDITATFKRIRREQQAVAKVVHIKPKKARA